MRRLIASMLGAASMVVTAHGGFILGPDWKEGSDGTGDAGSFPGTAQIPTTEFPFPSQLRTIAGTLATFSFVGGPDQQDVYGIYIQTPTVFTATTDSFVDALGFTSFDSQLFLFDAAGLPVVANDGLGDGATVTLPTFALVPGIYYLAISLFNSDPFNASSSLLFPDLTGPQVLPSSVALPAFWGSSPLDGGDYVIALEGAVFIPAPAAWLAPLLAIARQRRRRAPG